MLKLHILHIFPTEAPIFHRKVQDRRNKNMKKQRLEKITNLAHITGQILDLDNQHRLNSGQKLGKHKRMQVVNPGI